ncbi:hypothetical protein [Pseudoxanthomonas wuyuanensis]
MKTSRATAVAASITASAAMTATGSESFPIPTMPSTTGIQA